MIGAGCGIGEHNLSQHSVKWCEKSGLAPKLYVAGPLKAEGGSETLIGLDCAGPWLRLYDKPNSGQTRLE